METKAIVMTALNAALLLFSKRGGKISYRDVVVDYNRDDVKVATFCTRHPGWIELYVRLEEGTGLFFIKSETTMYGNIYYIAWEEDNSSSSFLEITRDLYKNIYGKDYKKALKLLYKELEYIVTKGLSI